jgi:D-glycero-alpha-D-manno-heptose-7-phosphate kinase
MIMQACARAPVRVDPAGGGTDAPPFCLEHGGAVVNFTVERHVFATAQRLVPGSGIIIRAMDLDAGVVADDVTGLPADEHLEFLKAFVQRLVPPGDSLLLLTESDVPAGSGLGGSGALGVAIVAAIDRAYERTRPALETAALANEIERKDLGYPGGDQDSYGPALGGFNLLEYHAGGGMTPHKVQISDATRHALEHQSLLIYTGAAHVSGSIHEDILRSYAQENSPTVAALRVLQQQAQLMAAALKAGDLRSYAAAMDESCRQLYNLHESCSSDEHRRYLEELDDCIWGRKTCGAGGGGFLLVLARPGRRRECIRRVQQMGGLVWPVTIDTTGLTCWQQPGFAADEIDVIRQAVLVADDL